MLNAPTVISGISHAKVNLSLRILGRRDDGFHELETVMARLEFGDEISVAVTPGGEGVVCRVEGMPELEEDESNLAVKAAHAYSQISENPFGCEITLKKRIPMGAGLGGGSSNAAVVLRTLDAVLCEHGGGSRLNEVAASLGSDVPFFLGAPVARCTGRGEEIVPVRDPVLPAKEILLVKPPFGVSTPEAYSRWKDSIEIPDVDYASQKFGEFQMFNDLEKPVFEKYLVLADLKGWLRRQPEVEGALMSGSGATVFAILSGDSGALEERIRVEFGESFWIQRSAFCSSGSGS